jgi:hypothetical protein
VASPSELAIEKLTLELESRKSVELKLLTSIKHERVNGASATGFSTLEEHYIETAAGQRFHDFKGLISGKVTTHLQHYSDGAKAYDVMFSDTDLERQSAISVKRHYYMEDRGDRKSLPQPLLYLYVGRVPLHRALPKAQFLGTEKVIGRACDKFLFPAVPWTVVQDQIFYLDQETAIPLKVEAFQDKQAREREKQAGERGLQFYEWTARSLDVVDGRPIPLKSVTISRDRDGKPRMISEFSVESVIFDKDYPASMFAPTREAGVTIMDGLTGKTSRTPESKASEKAGDQRSESKTSTFIPPNPAVPPDSWASKAWMGSMALGIAMLLAGCVLWWRRR